MPFKLVKFNKYRHKGSNWITAGIMKYIKYKNNLYSIVQKTDRSSAEYQILKQNLPTYDALLKKAIREAKTIYYNDILENNKTVMRKMWTAINEIICKTKYKKVCIKAIATGGKLIKDPDIIAEKVNEFFVNIGPSLLKNNRLIENKTYQMYMTKIILTSFQFSLIDGAIYDKVVSSLHTKTSSGHDGISVKLLKYLFKYGIRWSSSLTNWKSQKSFLSSTRRSENDNTPQPLDQWMNSPFMGQLVGNCKSFTLTHALLGWSICHAPWPKVIPIVHPTSYPTHIPFIPSESTLPFQNYSNFNILPWKSKVKVMGEVKVWSHNVNLTFYRLTSLYFHVNRPSHSWDMTFSKFDLENPRSMSWVRVESHRV